MANAAKHVTAADGEELLVWLPKLLATTVFCRSTTFQLLVGMWLERHSSA
jgi:hypothetical protein